MALRFSDRFLNRLGQTPSFGKRLTDIAGGLTAYPGMIAEQNKIKNMGMLELAQYNLEKAKTPQERAQALNVLEQAKTQTGNAAIDPILTAAMQTNNPDLIKSLGQSAVNVGAKMGMPTAEIAKTFEGMMTGKRESNATTAADRLMAVINNTQDPRIQDSLQKTLEETLARANLPTAQVAGYASKVRADRRQDKLNAARADQFFKNQEDEANEQTYLDFVTANQNDFAKLFNVQSTSDIDLERARQIENALVSKAEQNNKDATKFIGMADKSVSEFINTQNEQRQAAREQYALDRKNISTDIGRSAFNARKNIQNIDTWFDVRFASKEFEGVENKEELRSMAKDEFYRLEKAENERRQIEEKGVISDEIYKFISDPKNEGLFDNNAYVQDRIKKYETTQDKSEKRRLARELNKVFEEAQAKQRKIASNDTVIKNRITEELIQYKKDYESLSGWFDNEDVRGAIDIIEEDEKLLERFNNKMFVLYKNNPEINANTAINMVVNEMFEETKAGESESRQKRLDAISEDRAARMIREAELQEIEFYFDVDRQEAESILRQRMARGANEATGRLTFPVRGEN